MTMTANERRESKLNDLMISVGAQIDREEKGFPKKEINKARKNLIKNVSGMYSAEEVNDYLQNERDTRAEAKREQVLNANPLLETRQIRNEGGNIEDQMSSLMSQKEEVPMQEPMDEPMDEPMNEPMDEQMTKMMMEREQPSMLPDEEMEEDYVDYVVGKTLSEEDNQYLMSMLEQDDRLSVIFDQVVESATEFSGEGPIEGPGTETSDSIPARLSDGEFVITAKAVEEIGEDTLMSMMKDAEAAADERQMAYEGGPIKEEKEVMAAPKEPQQQNINVTKSTLDNGALLSRDQEDLVGKAVKENMMLDPYQRHVRS
jgi:hypothetical protein